MDDLITKRQAVERMNDLMVFELEMTRPPTWNEVYNAIEELPAIQQWIPCSERLPDFEEEVLVDYHGRVRLATLSKHDEEYPWYIIVSRFNTKLETVKAWMPLPEPYKGESNG